MNAAQFSQACCDLATLSIALHGDGADKIKETAFKSTLGLRTGSVKSFDFAKYSDDIFPRINYVLQWLDMHCPGGAFTPRALFFAGRLHQGALDLQLQSCAKMNECIDRTEIQSEAVLRRKISDLNEFSRGSLNTNALRMQEVRDFVQHVRCGNLDKEVDAFDDSSGWHSHGFLRGAIGHVLRSSRTYAINDEAARAPQGQVSQSEVDGLVEERAKLAGMALEEDFERRVRQRSLSQFGR